MKPTKIHKSVNMFRTLFTNTKYLCVCERTNILLSK